MSRYIIAYCIGFCFLQIIGWIIYMKCIQHDLKIEIIFSEYVHFLRTLFIRPANGSLNPGAAGLVVVLAGLVDPVGVDVGGPPPVGPAGLAAAEAAAAASSGRNIYSQC